MNPKISQKTLRDLNVIGELMEHKDYYQTTVKKIQQSDCAGPQELLLSTVKFRKQCWVGKNRPTPRTDDLTQNQKKNETDYWHP